MSRRLYCPKDHVELVVARIVTACAHGHINDFPWVKWVHAKNFGGAKDMMRKSEADIYDKSDGFRRFGRSQHKMHDLANVSATLKDAFNEGEFARLDDKFGGKYDFSGDGGHPWKNEKEGCGIYPKVLQRGSSSVYFPVTASSPRNSSVFRHH